MVISWMVDARYVMPSPQHRNASNVKKRYAQLAFGPKWGYARPVGTAELVK